MPDLPILVASLFAATHHSPPNRRWLDLQLQFLRENTDGPYQHAAMLAGTIDRSWFDDSIIICETPELPSVPQYITQQNTLIEYFRKHRKQYSALLILDSDAFPVRKKWDRWIRFFMKERGRLAASAVRCENLDTFPHACVCFALSEYFDHSAMVIEDNWRTDLYNRTFMEVAVELNRNLWMPMLRTNVWNPHPIESAIYGHMFFHQGAGSRKRFFRADRDVFYNERNKADTLELLFADPKGHIDRLMGYAPLLS